MRNSLLLLCLGLFISCSQNYDKDKSDERLSREESLIIANREEKKLISEASSQRSQTIRKILDPSTFAEKVSLAQKYFAQMPIELGIKSKDAELVKAESIEELIQTLEIISREINFNYTNPYKVKSEPEKAFYAIAASIHNTKDSSLENLIKNSFTEEALVGVNFNETAQELVQELFKARVDILAALSLGELEEARFTIKKLSQGFIEETKNVELGLSSNLKSALDAKRFLQRINVKFKLDRRVKTQLKRAKIERKTKKDLTEEERLRIEEIEEIIDELVSR